MSGKTVAGSAIVVPIAKKNPWIMFLMLFDVLSILFLNIVPKLKFMVCKTIILFLQNFLLLQL